MHRGGLVIGEIELVAVRVRFTTFVLCIAVRHHVLSGADIG